MKDFYVVAYQADGHFATISGLGRNKRTLDCSLSKRSARKHAKKLSKQSGWSDFTIKVETMIVDEVFGVFKNGIEITA